MYSKRNKSKSRILNNFWDELKNCFNLDMFNVFSQKPKIYIWFFFTIFTLISGYIRYALIEPMHFVVFVILTSFTYLTFISFISSNVVEMILRYSNGVRRIATDTEKERLNPLFNEVYKKALRRNRNIGKRVKLYIVDSMEINAFVIGRNTLAITRGAIATFNDEEIKGVMAHEFGHLNNFDGQIALLIKFCSTIFLWLFIGVSFIFRFLENLFQNNILGDIFGIIRQIFELVIKAVVFIWTLVISGGSRNTEYKADQYAKRLGYGEQLKSALYILYDMEISDKKGLIKNLKRTHPILAYRIEKLKKA